MSTQKLGAYIGALVFLIIALVSLYRLLFWFPISIGGAEVGQTASFFAFAISAALFLIFLRGAKATG